MAMNGMGGCRALAAAAALAVGTMALVQPAHAITAAGGVRVGTLGIGAEAIVGINDYINLRVPFNLFSYNYDQEEDGVDYDGKLKLQSFGVQADVHPFKGSFFLSAGLYANGNKLDLHSTDSGGEEEYELGESTYTSDPNDPLDLTGGLDFKSTAPYLGLGWGNAIQGSSNFYFRFELGAYFQGAGKVSLKASGSALNTDNGESFKVNDGSPEAQAFQADLNEERGSLEDDISDFKIYPAISFAFGYRFKF